MRSSSPPNLDQFLDQLAHEALPGDRLPTIRELMKRFGASQMLVQRAFQGLKDKGFGNIGMLNDGDPKTQDLMRQLRETWDSAPTEPQLDNTRVKIPGYLVPLEESAAGHTEFLLVPYFGACVHTPPPPANQIVLVVPAKPAAGYRSMDTVWVSGTLKATRTNSPMGSSGYRLEGALVERYKATAR